MKQSNHYGSVTISTQTSETVQKDMKHKDIKKKKHCFSSNADKVPFNIILDDVALDI